MIVVAVASGTSADGLDTAAVRNAPVGDDALELDVLHALAPYGVTEVVASGGGTHNPVLMAALGRALHPARLRRSDELGLPVDAKEAVMRALLGWLSWHGLPGTAGATGARGPGMLGRFTPGSGPLTLPSPASTVPARVRLRVPAGAR